MNGGPPGRQSWMSGLRTVMSGPKCLHDDFTNCISASCHHLFIILRYPILKNSSSCVQHLAHILLVHPAFKSYFSCQKMVEPSEAPPKLTWPIMNILLNGSKMAGYLVSLLVNFAGSKFLTSRQTHSTNDQSPTSHLIQSLKPSTYPSYCGCSLFQPSYLIRFN